jgi:hypothetical protein
MNGRTVYDNVVNTGELSNFTEAQCRIFIDMAQKKASLDLPVIRGIDIASVAANEIFPAPGVMNIYSAESINGTYPLNNIRILPHGLQFLEAATDIHIMCSGLSPDYYNMTEELTIHPMLQAPLQYYVLSMYYDMEGEGDSEESALAERFYQRWMYYKNMAITQIQGSMGGDGSDGGPLSYDQNLRQPQGTVDVMGGYTHRGRGRGCCNWNVEQWDYIDGHYTILNESTRRLTNLGR